MSKFDKNSIQNTVRKILSFYIMEDLYNVDATISLVDSGYEIDSIVMIGILVALEDIFDIEFTDEELVSNEIFSVDSLTEAVCKHIGVE